jgi:phage I-like protein
LKVNEMAVQLAPLWSLGLTEEGRAPDAFRIFAAGENETKKGVVVFDEESGAAVLSAFAAGGVELPIDWEHAMANDQSPVEQRRAAGWFSPAVRGGELWATEVTWTAEARSAIEGQLWRFISPWGVFESLTEDESRLRLRRLLNVGLVNRPATLNALPLLSGKAAPIAPAAAQLSEGGSDARAVLLGELAGHMLSAETLAWARSTPIAALRAFASGLPSVPSRPRDGLTDDDRMVARLLGLSDDDMRQEKTRLLALADDAARPTSREESDAQVARLLGLDVADMRPQPAAKVADCTEDERHVASLLGLTPAEMAKHKTEGSRC